MLDISVYEKDVITDILFSLATPVTPTGFSLSLSLSRLIYIHTYIYIYIYIYICTYMYIYILFLLIYFCTRVFIIMQHIQVNKAYVLERYLHLLVSAFIKRLGWRRDPDIY